MVALNTEYAIIDANHRIDTQRITEIKLLRILLRQARGEWFSTADKFAIQDCLKQCPELADMYNVEVRKPL
jgi:hypothetical protein